jgi:predicted dehydrogenase
MKFGLIGCGGIGSLRANAVSATPGMQLTAVSDVDAGRAAGLAGRHGAAVSKDWQELVRRSDVDAVIVSTPPALHAEMCVAALQAGKHVLCEKPLTRTAEEGRQVVAAASASGKFLATGFNYRFYPSVLLARQWLDAGMIGELDHIRSYAGYSAKDHNPQWVHDVGVMGGGALRDNGIHLIDLTAYFLGGVAEVKGASSQGVWDFPGCEDNGFAILRSPAGRLASLQASWTEWQGYRFAVELYGTRGCIRATCFPMHTYLTQFDALGGPARRRAEKFFNVFVMEHLRSYRWLVVQSFILEFQAFASAAAGGPPSAQGAAIATGADGLRAIEVAQAAGL